MAQYHKRLGVLRNHLLCADDDVISAGSRLSREKRFKVCYGKHALRFTHLTTYLKITVQLVFRKILNIVNKVDNLFKYEYE
jgi:hypothetical protein